MKNSSPPTSLTLLGQLQQRTQPDAWARFVHLYTHPSSRSGVVLNSLQALELRDL